MLDQFSRTRLLLGRPAMEKLAKCRVAVFGIGGVGGYAAEALVRSGIGAIDLIDDDRICLTNLNRQVFATRETVGKDKVDAAEERLHAINPDVKITKHKCFYMPDTAAEFHFQDYDYVVDAVDTVTAKLSIIQEAKSAGVPVISCMGAGNKLDATKFRVADLYKTKVCPLAKVMRYECRKRGIDHLKVVYSEELPIRPLNDSSVSCRSACICPPGTRRKCTARRDIPGSNAYVPPVAGFILAGEVIGDLTKEEFTRRGEEISDTLSAPE